MNKRDIEKLFAYTHWANGLALGAAEKLSPDLLMQDVGGSFPSVFKTLEHMLAAEWVWYKRLNGVSPPTMFDGHTCLTIYELGERWSINDLQWTAFIEAMSDEDLMREISYTNLAGENYAKSLAAIMQHVPNHATYHRGQVVNMLRQIGAEGFSSDMIFFDSDK
jgi:uncharacterized damage-inducible protein DinB